MISFEDIKTYLPKYLSPESEQKLFADLKEFPSNIVGNRLYTIRLRDDKVIYQGDGLEGLLAINLPETEIHSLPAMILSNTCDIGPDKKSFRPSNNIVYSPILNYDKYIERVVKPIKSDEDSLHSHENAVKRQEISSIFYLPKSGRLVNDSLVFLDKVISCDAKYFKDLNLEKSRIFTLSDYGFYLFLFKLSIHFTRIREGVDRGVGSSLESG